MNRELAVQVIKYRVSKKAKVTVDAGKLYELLIKANQFAQGFATSGDQPARLGICVEEVLLSVE